MAITVNNYIYRNLQEQVLYLTDKVGDHATVPATVTFPYGEPEVQYNTVNGATVLGKARLTYADGSEPADIDINFTLPVVGDGITIDVSADAKQLVIKSNGGGGESNILNLDFVNGTTSITAAEFEKFKNPALVIWGYYQDPNETNTGKLALRMADYSLDNDTSEEVFNFVPAVQSTAKTQLTATHNGGTYSYTIANGYIPGGTVINFSIDGSPKTASEVPYTWETWVNSPEGEGWFIKTNSDGEQVITSDDAAEPTYWVSKDEMDNFAVNPTDTIIDGYEYYTYAP